MDLKELQDHWEAWARTDPLWSIMTLPDKQGGRWKVEEFFETGRGQVHEVMRHLGACGVTLLRRRAMDFGCGVGRLTQALAHHFEEVDGVDISPSMIELARKYNRHGARCRYHLNDSDHLRLFPADRFDLVYSHITLQHIHPTYAKGYIAEFMRILAPGGVTLFQLPSEPVLELKIRARVKRLIPPPCLRVYRRLASSRRAMFEMYAIETAEVVRVIEAHGGRVARITADGHSAPGWVSHQYVATKS